ncbi:hypothetical protein [Desulfovibrio litoralis]|uniref:Uncharacterized protein n=1 Tax=Desulfovibrio litoralis DSM 11393 TaxID=1121455 RepID=A0A1M7SP41_9BACT|nr:hypothetical protein [Desulfovibrio litoralis]SHN60176.1 hypothetical protein SAMN02745728_01092 [Desulfovibrio litoralis DSM 11393]
MSSSLIPDDPRFERGKLNDDFSIVYGISNEAFPHNVDAEYLALSILGLTSTLKKISKEILGVNIQVTIGANKEGSLEIFASIITLVFAPMTLLQFFGYDYKKTKGAIGGFLLNVIKVISNKLKATNGELDLFIEAISKDELMSNEEKNTLIKLINDAKIRDGLDDFTKVLEHNDVSKIELKQDNINIIALEKKDRKYFILSSPEEQSITTENKLVKIVYISPFKTKWQFSSEGQMFWATIDNDQFIDDIKDTDMAELESMYFDAKIITTSYKKIGSKRASVSRIITDIVKYDFPLFNHQDNNSPKTI